MITLKKLRYKFRFKEWPELDAAERAYCRQAGYPLHWDCGICNECNKPYFKCKHQAPRKKPYMNSISHKIAKVLDRMFIPTSRGQWQVGNWFNIVCEDGLGWRIYIIKGEK